MFEVNKCYNITIVDGDSVISSSYRVLEIDGFLIKAEDYKGIISIINTASFHFIKAKQVSEDDLKPRVMQISDEVLAGFKGGSK